MLPELELHNLFRDSLKHYLTYDPHLKKLRDLACVYQSPLLKTDNFKTPGIYLLTGGRQTGKTTFLKQYISMILKKKEVVPGAVYFITGEIINNHHQLRSLLQQFLENNSFKKKQAGL
ncbi:MAG TPA: hypothetical protein VKS21_00770 [Spirochaetota bacterium]|nr:hypothetical protein [Spirochaetota bacterium]